MQVRTNKRLARSNELVLAENVHGDIVGCVTSRKGYTQTGDTLESGKSILGIGQVQLTSGTKQHLASVNNGGDTNAVLKYNNSGSWANISGATSLPANAKSRFAAFIDKIFHVGSTTDSSPSFITTASYDGTTYSSTSFPSARYAIVFRNRLYLLYAKVGSTVFPSRFYYSSIPTYSGGWVITFDTSEGFDQVQTDDGDYITGAAVSFDRLLIFKKNSLHMFDRINIDQVDNIGASAPDSIVTVNNNVFFLHWGAKHKGIYQWNGQGAQKVSRAIDPFIEGMDSSFIENGVVSGLYQDHVLMFLGDITLDSDISDYYNIPQTYTNVIADYNFSNNQWAIHTVPVVVTAFGEYDGNLYLGDENGKVYQWALGNDDDGTPIASRVITHRIYGDNRNSRKSWKNVVINMHKSTATNALVSTDGGVWASLGQLKKPDEYFSMSLKGFSTQYQINSKHSGERFIFEGVAGDYIDEGKIIRNG